jgi:ABC-type branched-subunit amino acid transport system ATPase component
MVAGQTAMSMLRLESVGRRFGGLVALQEMTIDIEAGTCNAVIGPNGAGKTTLLNLIAGTLRPTSGRVILDGRDVTALGAARRARLGIGRTFQHPALFARLSVADNLSLASRDPERVARLVEQTGLGSHGHTPAGRLPYGLQRRLELAMALARRPRLLLLDEPSAGLDPHEISDLTAHLRDLAGTTTVLLADHNLDLVWELARTITVLHHGRHLATGSGPQVRADPAVHDAYLATGTRRPTTRRPGAAGPVLLRVRDVRAGYHGAPVLHGVDLELHQGETLAVLGRNGAGKTTLLSTVAGLLPIRRPGRIELDGLPLPTRRAHDPARAGIAIVPQGRRLFAPLTVAEHLRAARRSSAGPPQWTIDEILDVLPELAARTRHQARHLSGGEQQMLALARALLTQPRLLVLDEPSEGLAPSVIAALTAALATLAGRGMAILIAEQNLALANAVADRVAVLDRGRLAMTCSTADLDAPKQQQRLGVLLGVTQR